MCIRDRGNIDDMQELKQLKDINTDGVTESRRDQGFFGITGVKKACKESAGTDLGELASAVCKAADRFHDPHLPPDDRLVLATRISRPAQRAEEVRSCLLYTSPSPRDRTRSRMPSSA